LGDLWVAGEDAAQALDEDLDEVEAICDRQSEGLLFEFDEGHGLDLQEWVGLAAGSSLLDGILPRHRVFWVVAAEICDAPNKHGVSASTAARR
jgi:hypothetical protein